MLKQTDEIEAGSESSRRESSRQWGVVLRFMLPLALLLGLVFVLGQGLGKNVAVAQSDAPAASEITPDEVNEVARQLWCPLCSGVRLDACELKACDQMKEMIAIKLSEGEDTESIKAYFVEQYGPQVMGEPPREGFNWLAWILPVVGLVVGGYVFWRTTQRMVRPTTKLDAALAADLVSDVSNPLSPPVSAPSVIKPQVSDNPDDIIDADDVYTQKLEEELAKYG